MIKSLAFAALMAAASVNAAYTGSCPANSVVANQPFASEKDINVVSLTATATFGGSANIVFTAKDSTNTVGFTTESFYGVR